MAGTWYSKTNETIIPGNPDRIKAKWDPLQYLNLAKYLKVFNEYPPGFNPRVHGVYCPWRYYGKRMFNKTKNLIVIFLCSGDLQIADVKLLDLPAWIARRDKTPMGIYQAGVRSKLKMISLKATKNKMKIFNLAFWKFYRSYMDNKKPNLIWLAQIFVAASLFNFVFFAIPDRSKLSYPNNIFLIITFFFCFHRALQMG